jgi:hypothetical protein
MTLSIIPLSILSLRIVTVSIFTLSIMPLTIVSLSLTAFYIMTLSTMPLSIFNTQHNGTQDYNIQHNYNQHSA